MENDQHKNIFVITGDVQSGKTTFLTRLVDTMKSEGYKVSGFLCTGYFEDGERSSFTLTDIRSSKSYPLASIHPGPGWIQFRKFYFDPSAVKRGNQILNDCHQEDPDILVIDEVGPMELEGQGWGDAVEIMVKNFNLAQLWVVRQNVLKDVMTRWKISSENVVSVDPDDSKAVNRLMGKLKEYINQ